MRECSEAPFHFREAIVTSSQIQNKRGVDVHSILLACPFGSFSFEFLQILPIEMHSSVFLKSVLFGSPFPQSSNNTHAAVCELPSSIYHLHVFVKIKASGTCAFCDHRWLFWDIIYIWRIFVSNKMLNIMRTNVSIVMHIFNRPFTVLCLITQAEADTLDPYRDSFP